MAIFNQTHPSPELLTIIRDISQQLDLDSYSDMDAAHERSETLRKLEALLTDRLALAPAETLKAPERDIVRCFLQAYLLEGLYPDTVGEPEQLIASLKLVTLPHFTTRRMSPERRTAIFHTLRKHHGMDHIDAEPALNASYVADCHLHLRRTLIDHLRKRHAEADSTTEIKALFDRFFPGNPLRADDVDIVITRTALYWVVPDRASLKDNPDFLQRDPEDQEAIRAFLKIMGRFAFQYFSHFPTFSSFDVRDSDPSLLDELVAEMHLPTHFVVELINRSVSIERREVIEKYLLHDTWGHMWQGDLTKLGMLYDRMESLKAPVEALEPLTIEDNVASLLDILYLDMKGAIQFNESLAEPFIEQWTRQRMEAMFAPVVAELTADMLEYKFRLDHPEDADLLPSSSMFGHKPCKLDFAWVDLGYFSREVERANRAYWENEGLRDNLVDRVCLLLRLKYPRQAAAAEEVTLREQVATSLTAFLDRLRARQDQELNTSLKPTPDGNPNAFTQVLINLLQTQCTLNQLIEAHLVPEELSAYYVVLCIFVALYYCQHPSKNFWELDQVIAEYALPLLRDIKRAEGMIPA